MAGRPNTRRDRTRAGYRNESANRSRCRWRHPNGFWGQARARVHEWAGAHRRSAALYRQLDLHCCLFRCRLRPCTSDTEALAMTAPFSETGVIGPQGVLLASPVIGFAFGWFLERGGLGSASKLAGQFYLTDLTVFKVMFSALLTAALGTFWLNAFGVLDLSLVYLPETFVLPQALGGF